MLDKLFFCPLCGAETIESDGVLDLECLECGAEATIEWDDDEEEYYAYVDDEDNMPECCIACGCGAYPDCISSCKIFDD